MIQSIRNFYRSEFYVGIEFGIEKYTIVIRKSGIRETTGGIELPNRERIMILGKKANYKYLKILEVDIIK